MRLNLRDQPMNKKVSDGRKNNGGAREGAGRKPGVPNKAPNEFREYVRQYTTRAADFFVAVMDNSAETTERRMFAANWLVERGYGKASQHIETKVEGEGHTTMNYNNFEEVKIALLEEGIDFDRVPLPRMIEDARRNG
jgi:hypothetical protein